MNEVAFVERRESDWKRINYLVDRADANIKTLTPEELREFIKLYRRVAGDLAVVRTRSMNLELVEFLNDLVGKAYTTIYRSPRNPLGRSILLGIASAAQAVRRLKWFVLTSVLIFLGSAFWANWVLTIRPRAIDVLVPEQFKESFEIWKSGKHREASLGSDVTMTFFYSANNPTAAIVTGASAAGTFGVGSVQSLYSNGTTLGALYHEVNAVGHADHLLYSIAPHGVTEISGFILAASAGLSLGWALICPGRKKRGAALAHAAKDALIVICTAIVMMFMAAPVEGFFSFNPHIPNVWKAAFAIAAATGWAAFWIGFAREDRVET